MKFVIKQAKNKEWFYLIVGSNGKTMLQSETMKRRRSCLKAITSIKAGAKTGKIVG